MSSFAAMKSTAAELIDEARNGRMFVLVDDEDRENEGDLVIPAQMATPEAINFMAKHGRGLICLALERSRVDDLGLPLMPRRNESRFGTAFTVSIEAKEGVTTGISAPDRARTIAVAIDQGKSGDDLETPGHVFPLVARDGGTLVRAGHTEAAVDIARLAGLNPSGVICEIMNDDGTMARRDDLVAFAQLHSLKIGTIADLIAYRLENDRTVTRKQSGDFETTYGGSFALSTYHHRIDNSEHTVLVKGTLDPDAPTLVRVHVLNVLDDLLGNKASDRRGALQAAMKRIDEEQQGVVLLLHEPQSVGADDPANAEGRLRSYGVGAQILYDLGVRRMRLLTNSKISLAALEGYGLSIESVEPIDMTSAGVSQ